MKRSLFILFALFLLAQSFYAQETSTVRFYVKGSSDYFIRLDGEVLPHSNIQRITPGEHNIEIWSPMYLPYKGKLVVPENDSITYFQELEKDPNYVNYLFQKDEYKRKLLVSKTLPLMLAGTGVVAAPIFYFLRKRDHETLVIEDFKAKYIADESGAESARTRYTTSNGLFITSSVFAVGGLATYFFLKKRSDELKPPIYRQKNPFTLEDFELSYNPQLNAPQAKISWNF